MYDSLGSLPEFDSEAAVITSAPDDPEHKKWKLQKGYGIKTNETKPQKHSSAGWRAGGLSGGGEEGQGFFRYLLTGGTKPCQPRRRPRRPARPPRPGLRRARSGRPQPQRGPFPPKGACSSPQAPGQHRQMAFTAAASRTAPLNPLRAPPEP